MIGWSYGGRLPALTRKGSMNINIQQVCDPEGRSLQAIVDGSLAILARDARTIPIGDPVFVPEHDQDQYPGSYQVWFPVAGVPDGVMWAFVNTEGVVLYSYNPLGA